MYKGRYTVKQMCRALKISESGYYRWVRNHNKPSPRKLLSVRIQEILDEYPENKHYGVNRMHLALEQKGVLVSRRTVYRAMSEYGLLHKKRTPNGITRATTEVQEQENLLKQDFTEERPLKKLLSDITEVQCHDGKVYISPVLDCFDGSAVALQVGDNMKKELCVSTVEQLRQQYGRKLKGAVFHTDRGCQYTSGAFRKELAKAGMIQSLSGVGHCFDNARMESFFATLKKELIYPIAAYRLTREEVKKLVFRYVFVYYNRIRVYTSNPMGLPPVRYREWAKSHGAFPAENRAAER